MLASAVTASSTHRIGTSYTITTSICSTGTTTVFSTESSWLFDIQKIGSRACVGKKNANPSFDMMASRTALCIFVVFVAFVSLSAALPTGEREKNRLLNELDLVDDDGSIETALINYLFTKQVVKRMRNELDVSDLQRKRSYWKQCAFNAVSCFGKKKK